MTIDSILFVDQTPAASQETDLPENGAKKSEYDLLQSIFEVLKREIVKLRAVEFEAKIELLSSDHRGINLVKEGLVGPSEESLEKTFLHFADSM